MTDIVDSIFKPSIVQSVKSYSSIGSALCSHASYLTSTIRHSASFDLHEGWANFVAITFQCPFTSNPFIYGW